MAFELPTKFDLIVIGTGVVESIVSAAASRIGKTVLHIDSNDYYGGLWASFNVEAIERLCSDKIIHHDTQISLNDGEKILPIGNNLFNLENISQGWNVPMKVGEKEVDIELTDGNEKPKESDAEEGVKVKEWSKEEILKESRKFNIDLAPKLQFARGSFVELLISSNIARYSEYRSVSRVLTWINDQLEVVPCSRSDVFSNAKVSVIEKRMLMKLLTACLENDVDEFKDFENKTFLCYLKEKKLTENIIHYVLHAIAMCTNESSCMKGVNNVKRFLNSLGRFGKTPFLYSMYGSGELSQAFCRLSAVFGGIYALNQELNGLVLNESDNTFKALISGEQRISAENVVMGVEKSPELFVKSVEKTFISRATFIIDRSIMQSEKEHLTLLLFPVQDGKDLCYIFEMGSLTGTCPKKIYIVHMFMKQQCNPKEDMKECVSKLFQNVENKDCVVRDARPQILWSFYYSVPDTNTSDLTSGLPKNVYLCPGPDIDLDYDLSVEKAKEIFIKMYPDSEFLPRAPDPEEIIIGEDAVLEFDNDHNSHIEVGQETIEAIEPLP